MYIKQREFFAYISIFLSPSNSSTAAPATRCSVEHVI